MGTVIGPILHMGRRGFWWCQANVISVTELVRGGARAWSRACWTLESMLLGVLPCSPGPSSISVPSTGFLLGARQLELHDFQTCFKGHCLLTSNVFADCRNCEPKQTSLNSGDVLFGDSYYSSPSFCLIIIFPPPLSSRSALQLSGHGFGWGWCHVPTPRAKQNYN